MDKKLTDNLLRCAAEYVTAKGCAEATVAKKAADDSRFFRRLRDGKTFTVKRYDTVMGWFEANWPENAPWPDDVTRPSEEPLASEAA